jgi:hypothetical protein
MELCGSDVINRKWLGLFALINKGFDIIGGFTCDEFFQNIPDPDNPFGPPPA